MLAYLLERVLSVDPGPLGATPGMVPSRGVASAFAVTGQPRWDAVHAPRWAAALVLTRLADGDGAEDLCGELGMGEDVFKAALRDVARRSPTSEPRAQVFQWLSEGGRVDDRAASELGLTLEQLRDALEPTEALLNTVCAVIVARSAMPSPPSEYLGTSPEGPLQTVPVRFPQALHRRLRAWSVEHGFPMAVVVRGLVERFLDEQQRHAV